MLPYSRGLILDNTNNYGIMKTETVFGFGPPNPNKYVNDSFNSTEPLEWVFTHENFERNSLPEETESSRALKSTTKPTIKSSAEQRTTQKVKYAKTLPKNLKRKSKKVNKCVLKILKKGEGESNNGSYDSGGGKKTRRRRRGQGTKMNKMQKKIMMPVILGLLAAKSVLIPIALKALAFLSAKGLMMGFFSTVMASVLSLKGMFDHNHGQYQNRKDDTKTQVEIIQIPSKSEDHVYYDDHYRRGDIPMMPNRQAMEHHQHHHDFVPIDVVN